LNGKSRRREMALEMPEDIKDLVYKTWMPALMTTVFEAIKGLPPKQRKAILTKICITCEDMAMAGALGIQPGMSWNDYMKFVKEAPAPIGPWTIKKSKSGDIFDLTYDATIGKDGKPMCHCPFVLLGIREPFPECCDSGARLSGKMIEAATRKKVAKTEVIDSPARTGAAVCHYRVKVKK
jgi:hypothetical protein